MCNDNNTSNVKIIDSIFNRKKTKCLFLYDYVTVNAYNSGIGYED